MKTAETAPSTAKPPPETPERLVVIGASTGGPQALARILPDLPADLPATVVVVQQMRSGFTRVLADQLNHVCKLPIYEPEDGQALQSSRILMVPSGVSLSLCRANGAEESGCSILLEDVRACEDRRRKRTDETMASAAEVFGRSVVGVLLTGTGEDGCDGLHAIAQAGGATLAQDDASSVVHDLPASAIKAGFAQEVMPLWSIADRITQLVAREANAIAA